MSPEQARGRAVDRRADVWAFGCVLYELLTGSRAFDDEDVSLTLSKVLQRDPDFDRIPSAVPAHVRQAIRLCLRKNAKERIADMGSVRLALDGAFGTTAAMLPAGEPAAPRPIWQHPLAVAAAALVAGGQNWLTELRQLMRGTD